MDWISPNMAKMHIRPSTDSTNIICPKFICPLIQEDFEIVVSSEEWEKKTIEAIQKAAYTGEVGDGKIFSYEIRSAMKIRTRETGYDALQSKEQIL